MNRRYHFVHILNILCLVSLCLTACLPLSAPATSALLVSSTPTPAPSPQATNPDSQSTKYPVQTPFPERPFYQPGELVDYIAQPGDTVPVMAIHFNTSVTEILAANPIIPKDATTMPPGMPMKIPIYYLPLWGIPYQIIPDDLYINGPAQVNFNTPAFVNSQSGWLINYRGAAGGELHSGAEIVDLVARNFSVSPRLLLALLEYQHSALSQLTQPSEDDPYILGYADPLHGGLNLQLVWAANTLNNGYYAWRSGDLRTITRQDGSIEHPDPWQNAATVALQYYFSILFPRDDYLRAIGPDGFAKTYNELFGDVWATVQPHIPGSLVQPEFTLPFEIGKSWALTGGPHTGWGEGAPWAALDFAPPSVVGGCVSSDEWVTAIASGLVVRSEPGIVVLDLDSDGDERTGWMIFYLHIGTPDRVQVGTKLAVGNHIGHPSCEGGSSTGTHVHIARKYNGEWILAAGTLAFNLEGWLAYNGSEAYLGGLKKYGRTVTACVCSNANSQVKSGER